MECINHPGTPAAGSCQLCGKALCAACMNRFSPPLCQPCLIGHNASVARRLYIDLGITAVIFFGMLIVMLVRNPAQIHAAIIFGLMFSCAYWGWQFLSRFSVPVFFTSGLGLITYLFIKFTLSVFIGFIVAPWQIFRRIKEIAAINSLKKRIEQGKA
jgi:hypothetical protein